MNFSAVILAGGKSSRMGRDKAGLEIGGQTLLARQIALARKVGAAEIFISGRDDADYSAFGCYVLHDKFSDAGPLAGIERALDAAKSSLLLVLAVDLPEMSEELLRRLSAGAAESLGAIPRLADHIEPLAAFYPKTALPLLVKLLDGSSLTANQVVARASRPYEPKLTVETPVLLRRSKSASAKRFAELCVQSGLANFIELAVTEIRYFANWNSPADMPPMAMKGCSSS